MTDHHSIPLRGPADHENAVKLISWAANKLGEGWTLVLSRKRTVEQNARLWAQLGRIAKARPIHCQINMGPEDYKTLFMHALGHEARLVPDLDGNGFVPLGYRSSALSKQQFSDLFELIEAWAAREGIDISDPRRKEAA